MLKIKHYNGVLGDSNVSGRNNDILAPLPVMAFVRVIGLVYSIISLVWTSMYV